MPRTIYYLTHERTLQPGDYYARNGVVPIVVLGGNGVNLQGSRWPWGTSIGPIAAKLKGPWHVAVWAQGPQGKTLAPWDAEGEWQAVLGNLRALAALLPSSSGIFFDGEIYSATPNNNGGLMDATAWPAGVKAEQRGVQVREASGDRPLGQYVLVSDAKGHAGWRQFWGAAYKPGDLLLDEAGYLAGTRRATACTGQGVRNLPGRAIRGGKLGGKVPRGSFWVYPWSGDGPGVLEAVSGKWQ